MKVKMLEHYQDAQVHYLPDEEVDVSSVLGAWLVEHRKAVKLEVVGVHYGGQEEAELKLRDDEKLYGQMKEEAAQQSTPEEAAEFAKVLAESEESPDAVKPEMDEQGGMVIPEKAQIKRGRGKK